LVYFDDEINALDDIWAHQLIGALVGALQDGHPVRMRVLKELVHKVRLLMLLC
jgi:hypothetical protein